MFKIKDVIRIARKADYENAPTEVIRELITVYFTLLVNAYATMLERNLQQVATLWFLFDEFGRAIKNIGILATWADFDPWKELVGWAMAALGLTKKAPPKA